MTVRLVKMVNGSVVSLKDGRSVFVGQSDVEPDTTFIKFRNEAGIETRIKLSRGATRALKYLLSLDGKPAPEHSWVLVTDPTTAHSLELRDFDAPDFQE